MLDAEVSARDVLDLTGADQLAALFASLGYSTAGRLTQTPRNIVSAPWSLCSS